MLLNSFIRLLKKENYLCTATVDAGSLNGAGIYVKLSDDLSVRIWQHTKSTVGVRFNTSQYYMTCQNANQVLAVIMMIKDIKEE